MKLLLLVSFAACIFLAAPFSRGQDSSNCARLFQRECVGDTAFDCGCFDLIRMGGGILGGEIDVDSHMVKRAILISPSGVFRIFRGDTLEHQTTYTLRYDSVTSDLDRRYELILSKPFGGYSVYYDGIATIHLEIDNAVDQSGLTFLRYRK